MLKNLKNRQDGFTIIEVMIVLVIAAVILLIVFLAVPALQRNSRNTQKKNIVGNLLSAASESSSNNNGAIPTASVSACSPYDSTSCANAAAAPGATSATKILGLVNTNSVITQLAIRNPRSGAAPANLDWAVLEIKSKCQGNTTISGSSDRQIAMLYNVEGAGGSTQAACVDGGL